MMTRFPFAFLTIALCLRFTAAKGTGSDGIHSLFIDGGNVDIKSVPHVVAILLMGDILCGGSIISDRFILTSADCVVGFQPDVLSVRMGSNRHSDGGKVLKVKRVIPHEKFDYFDYDAALLELQEPIAFDDSSRPIALPTTEPAIKSKITFSGWGPIEEDYEISSTLRSAVLTTVARSDCTGPNEIVTERMICVEGPRFLLADNGGPADYNGTVVGIASFWADDVPGVLTNVANPEILNFIKKNAGLS